MTKCNRCHKPHKALNGMTPWDYFHSCANLGKYGLEKYICQCKWLDKQ